jgi:hypothetical protein
LEETAGLSRFDHPARAAFLRRWMSPEEQAWCRNCSDPPAALLALWCCREAVFKAGASEGCWEALPVIPREPDRIYFVGGGESHERGSELRLMWTRGPEHLIAVAVFLGPDRASARTTAPVRPDQYRRAKPSRQSQEAPGELGGSADCCPVGEAVQRHGKEKLGLLCPDDEAGIGKCLLDLRWREGHESAGVQLDLLLQSEEVLGDQIGAAQ